MISPLPSLPHTQTNKQHTCILPTHPSSHRRASSCSTPALHLSSFSSSVTCLHTENAHRNRHVAIRSTARISSALCCCVSSTTSRQPHKASRSRLVRRACARWWATWRASTRTVVWLRQEAKAAASRRRCTCTNMVSRRWRCWCFSRATSLWVVYWWWMGGLSMNGAHLSLLLSLCAVHMYVCTAHNPPDNNNIKTTYKDHLHRNKIITSMHAQERTLLNIPPPQDDLTLDLPLIMSLHHCHTPQQALVQPLLELHHTCIAPV